MPAWIGPAIGAAASLLGGRESSQANAAAMRENMAFQREFAQHGVRWRVEDAKAAGLHPLYAMGFQPPMAAPIAFPDAKGPALAEAGQQVGAAVAAAMNNSERQAHAASLRVASSQADANEAQAAYYGSLAMRNMQEMNSRPGLGGPSIGSAIVPEGQAPQMLQGQVELVAPQVGTSSGDPGVQSGIGEMWQRWRLAPDLEVVLPATLQGSPSEALESLSESALLMGIVAQENRRRYGERNWNLFMQRYFGARPAGEIEPGSLPFKDFARLLGDAWKRYVNKGGGYRTQGGF